MSIINLDTCIQREDESTAHWVRRVSAIIHSLDSINAVSAVLILEKNCRFVPLKQKLRRLKRHCNDMGELMAALIKYADSDNTKDPNSDEKGQQHNVAGQSQGNNGKCRHTDDGSDFVANTNAQSSDRRRKGKFQPQFGGSKFNLEVILSQPSQCIVVPISRQLTCGKIVIS